MSKPVKRTTLGTFYRGLDGDWCHLCGARVKDRKTVSFDLPWNAEETRRTGRRQGPSRWVRLCAVCLATGLSSCYEDEPDDGAGAKTASGDTLRTLSTVVAHLIYAARRIGEEKGSVLAAKPFLEEAYVNCARAVALIGDAFPSLMVRRDP